MSQEQPRRRQQEDDQNVQQQRQQQQEPIKYGDVFQVSGELADKPVAPQEAAMMQTAEATIFGQTQKGGTASAMQAAATINERAGLVGRLDATVVEGVTVTATDYPGARVVTETVGREVVGQYVAPTPVVQGGGGQQGTGGQGDAAAITIGEALEATARTAGDKPVEPSDAAAIQAAEMRATGSNVLTPGGISAQAQSAAALNVWSKDEDKVKLGEVLKDATTKLPADKVATREDAEGVFSAEARNNPNLTADPGGVAAAVAAAANINERSS